MNDDRIDVAALRGALDWTQQQLADYCDTDRSTVSKWENEPPTKGPALILLRQLRDRASSIASGDAVTAEATRVAQTERAAAGDAPDLDSSNFDAASPDVPNARSVAAGPVALASTSQAGAGQPFQSIQETAE